jgi:hypothetical protein
VSLIPSFEHTKKFVAPLARLRPEVAGTSAVVGWGVFLWYGEPEPLLLLGVLAVHLASMLFLTALLARPRVAFAITTLALIAIFIASRAKFALVAMNLHAYDLAFYVSSAPVEFFFSAYPHQAWLMLLALAMSAIALSFVWRHDMPRNLSLRHRSQLIGAALVMGFLGHLPLAQRNADFFNERYFALSSFITSLGDLPQLFANKGFMEVAPRSSIPPITAGTITCKPVGTPPDIVLFLNESAMPPGVYPGLNYPPELNSFFQSFDGRIHPLRVETFGGGTWLTDFSALTGLSTYAFGSTRNFVANFMSGRLHHSLPQYLKACGYETAIIYPASAGFAGVGRFYEAIGFDRIIDTSIHRAPDQRQRDSFYLNEVAKIIEAQTDQTPRKPKFIVASSMSTHSPWNFRFAPEAQRETDQLRWNADVEFDEYLWRMVLAKRDRDQFRERLNKSVPDTKILYVSYGDHQPALAKIPLADYRAIADEGRSWQLDKTSKAFETYFSIDAKGFTPRFPGADHEITEVSYLPVITILAAGLPLDPVMMRRAWLFDHCKGLFATCPDRGSVLAFQRWLVDSRWIAEN